MKKRPARISRQSAASVKWFKALFTGWSVKEKILTPLIANLLTALCLFWVAFIFQDRIQNFIWPKEPIKEYPLRCFLEPRNDQAGNVLVDLFIINLLGDDQNHEALLASLNNHPQRGREVDPSIKIRMDDGLDSVIEKIEPDDEYNLDKGEISVGPLDPNKKTGTIFVESINERAILKITIHTTEQRTISSRASLGTIPLVVTCPGG